MRQAIVPALTLTFGVTVARADDFAACLGGGSLPEGPT